MLVRARGEIGVFGILSYRVGVANRIFISWGGGWIIRQILSWICFRGIVLQPLGDIIAVVFGKQSTTIAEGIDRVLLIYCQSMWEHHHSRKWDYGGRSGNANWYLMRWCIAFAGIGWDNNILQFETYCMSGSGPLALILLLFGGLNRPDAWQWGYYAMIWTMKIIGNRTIGFVWHRRREM